MRRSAQLTVPLLCLALAGAAFATPTGAATPTNAPSFGVPRVVDPLHVYGEPNLEVNPKTGAIHATGPQGTGTQRSIWNVSVDGGDSYRILQNLPGNVAQDGGTATLPTKSALGPGGGDTEIKIAHNGRAFFNDLAALASFTAVTTTDDGATTSIANPAAIGFPGGDRQWMALYDPLPSDRSISPYKGKVPLNYMEYADQANGDAVDISTDGTDYSTVAGEFGNDGDPVNGCIHCPNHGVPLVDQHTGRYLAMTTGNTKNSLALVVGLPDVAGKLTFHYNEMVGGLAGNPETLFPVLTQDGARNLYAVWVENKTYSVYYSWAAPGADNEWRHWSAPRQVSQAPANVNVFPWVAAGKAPGIIDVAWYGTASTLKQLGAKGPSAKVNQTWDLYFSQIDHANGASPHAQQLKAAPHPMHYNDICLLGTACITAAGNRNQADFFKLVVDPTNGRARIIYTDSSNRLSQTSSDTAADHQGAALDTIVTQNTGLNAYTGLPLLPYESTAPVSSITDPAGDALFRTLGGKAVPGADILSVKVGREGSDLVATIRTKSTLESAASTAGTPHAQVVLRWQMGDTLYFVAADAAVGAGTSYYGGKTSAVDLCSVSGCKPNYLTYDAPPATGIVTGTGTGTGTSDGGYTIRVPLSALGNPTSSSLLEEMMAFVVVSPQAGAVPQNNGTDFLDVAPLQLEGTRTFNFRFGSPVSADVPAPLLPGTLPTGHLPGTKAGGALAATGLRTTLPLLAVGLLGVAVGLRRRRTAG